MTLVFILLGVLSVADDTLWTEATEGYSITVMYPGIALENRILGSILQEYANDQVKKFIEQFQEHHHDEPPLHDWMLELNLVLEPSPGGMITILAWLWEYTGGAHGNTRTQAFIYSVSEQRLMDTVELLGGRENFETFAQAVIGCLKADEFFDPGWVERGAAMDAGNYHTVFPVPDHSGSLEGYAVLFPPYQVDCYATGVVEVFVPVHGSPTVCQ